MPRPAKRGVAATEWVRFRVTPKEKEMIEEAAGFQTLSDFAYQATMRKVKKMDEPIRASKPEPDATGHRHVRGKLMGQTTIKGRTLKTYQCTGCPEILEDR